MFSSPLQNNRFIKPHEVLSRIFLLLIILSIQGHCLWGQEPIPAPAAIADSTVNDLQPVADSVATDSILINNPVKQGSDLEDLVDYSSEDSLSISISEKKIFLYKSGSVV